MTMTKYQSPMVGHYILTLESQPSRISIRSSPTTKDRDMKLPGLLGSKDTKMPEKARSLSFLTRRYTSLIISSAVNGCGDIRAVARLRIIRKDKESRITFHLQ